MAEQDNSIPLVPLEPSEPVWRYKDIFDFYNRVRDVLYNTSVRSLTDEQIDMPEKAPSAERRIKQLVPNWQEFKTNDVDKFAIFESCIVYQTGIYFESYIKQKQPKRMQSSSINIEYSTSGNIKDRPETTLAQHLEDLLSLLIDTVDEDARFYGFMVTSPKGGV